LLQLDERIVVYSGLLHDIGKVMQRAKNDRRRHSELSAEFVKSFIPDWLGGKNEIARLVEAHHDPPRSPRDLKDSWWALTHADHTSAMEREIESSEEEKSTYQSHYRLLLNPFSFEEDENKRFCGLVPLELGNLSIVMPREDDRTTFHIYGKLLESIYNEINSLNSFYCKGCDFPYLVSLSEVVRKYLTLVPSAPSVEKIVTNSLYEHSRITAALATCFKRLGENNITIILGDVGKIQSFVYGQKVAKGALKSLRGRSLYITFLADAIAKHILMLLELPPVNLLYSSGGHFMILAPKISDEQKNSIRRQINNFLLNRHGGLLNVHIAFKDFEAGGSEEVGNIIKSVFEEPLSREKTRPFIDNLLDDYERIFDPIRSKDVCESCGITGGRAGELRELEDLKVCSNCYGLMSLAKAVANAKYLIEVWSPEGECPIFEDWGRPINFTTTADGDGLKICYYLAENEEQMKGIINILSKDEPLLIWVKTVNDSNFCGVLEYLKEFPENLRRIVAVGFWYMSRRTPSKNGDIYSFDELAEKSRGTREIAYLKMDLDHLGELIRRKSNTLSGLATISQRLSLIMEGMVDTILDSKDNLTYLIYSGGDDLLLVGPWNDVVTCSLILNERLRELFGAPRPTITAVIRTSDPKVPVKVVLDDINSDMQKAKNRRNCISYNGEVMEWRHFEEVLGFSEMWSKDIERGAVSRSLLFEVARIFSDYTSADEKYWRIHRSRLKYAISRALKTSRGGESIKELDGLEKKYLENIAFLFPIMRVVTDLTEKYTRKEVRT